MRPRVVVNDKDTRLALFFITLLATILDLMKKDMLRQKKKGRSMEKFDFEPYEKKMYAYESVYDAIIDAFINDIFGLYSNSIGSDEFKDCLIADGWKYFDIKNLNHFFSVKYHDKIEEGSIEALADIEEHQSDSDESFFKQNIEQGERVNQTTAVSLVAATHYTSNNRTEADVV